MTQTVFFCWGWEGPRPEGDAVAGSGGGMEDGAECGLGESVLARHWQDGQH